MVERFLRLYIWGMKFDFFISGTACGGSIPLRRTNKKSARFCKLSRSELFHTSSQIWWSVFYLLKLVLANYILRPLLRRITSALASASWP